MGKTVYSLVLSSEVVAAVDALAAQRGYSRSALVNHILAEYASVVSPQKQASQILDALQAQAGRQGMRPQAATAGSLTLRTAMNYKYNPALSYTVELAASGDGLGRLRVALRSQNAELLEYFAHFFELWALLEARHLDSPPHPSAHSQAPRRYIRALRRPSAAADNEQLGQAIADYIANMDACLKAFIGNCNDAGRAVMEAERTYLTGLGMGGAGMF